MISKLLPLLLFAPLLGCTGDEESFVVIHADINCEVPRVYQLRVTITNNKIPDQQFLPKTLGSNPVELGFPSTFSLILPGSKSSTFDLAIDALDHNFKVVGQATARDEIKPGGRIDLKIQIAKPPTICGDGIVEGSETCDDSNRVPSDGCNGQCQSEYPTPLDDGGIRNPDGGVWNPDGGGANRDGGISAASSAFLFVSVGMKNTCAIKHDSTLWCWGSNDESKSHLGKNSGIRTTPFNVGGTGWNRVSCGQSHTCALRTNNTLACFGLNTSGQLGGVPLSTDPTWVEVPGNDWKSVSAGEYHTCAVKTDGTLWCWGFNHNGQLGLGNTEKRTSPVQVIGLGWNTVSGNHQHTCATKEEGSLWCWGLNSAFQMAVPNISFSQEPIRVSGQDWLNATTGLYSTCALKTDGSLWCWGGNFSGQLGNTAIPIAPESKTANVTSVSGVNWKNLSAGLTHICAVNTSGKLLCWGNNKDGQLGNKDTTLIPTPTIIGTADQTWTMVSAGFTHTCAIATDGTLYCWGDNSMGQLGTGETDLRTTPAKVVN